MEEVKTAADSALALQHPLASPKDPPVVIPTLSRHRQEQTCSGQLPLTSNTLPFALSPPGSPLFGPKKPAHRHHQRHRLHSPSRNSATTTGATSISPKALHTHPTQLSLARDLTTRLWQREAELHTMKELYDAKIRRLTEMLQNAGVSPTEVENSLAVVANEETDGRRPLFDELSDTSDQEEPVEDEVDVRRQRGRRAGDGMNTPRRNLYVGACNNMFLQGHRLEEEDDGEEEDDEREEGEDYDLSGDRSDFMSSSGSLSLQSSCTTQLTKPDLTRHTSDSITTTDADTLSPKVETAAAKRRPASRTSRPFSPTPSEASSTFSIHSRQRPRVPHQPQTESTNASGSGKSNAKPQSSKPKAEPQEQGTDQAEEQGDPTGSQSPIPAFITDSLAAGTLSIKNLREKWSFAAGVLSWNKPKGEQDTASNSHCSSIVTSPTGLFIRRDGIVNDKKPAIVEATIPLPLQEELSPLPEKKDKEGDVWTSNAPTANRRQKAYSMQPTRPTSDLGFLGHHPKYPAMTMAREAPRPPITRIHDYLQQPDSYNPSPLHYRAIFLAASLIDSGAITPAKLYARRTQTMIAKWTLGLIMNSKAARSSQSSFPVIRESPLYEQEESVRQDGAEESSDRLRKEISTGMEMLSSNDRRSEAPIPTELPKAMSFKGHSTTPSFASSSYPHSSSSLNLYQSPYMAATKSVVELSDISSVSPMVSPSFSYLGDATGKPITDRYGFLVNARPMAVQQGLLKLNEVHAYDDMDCRSLGRRGHGGDAGAFEYLRTSSDELQSESTSPPPAPRFPAHVSSLYFGSGTVTGVSVGALTTGSATTCTTTTTSPTSVTSFPISTAKRPTSTLSPPTSSTATVTTLLSQIKVLHDSVQLTQKEKWDAFLRKRKRRVYLGETNGGTLVNMSSTNLGTPLFGNLMQSLEDPQEEDDEDVMYWTSVCLVGIAEIGKGADWEEFRDLVRGGIPVAYRNKIWQEVSGALDMRQPGYYKELLSKQKLEACQWWSDIEMDLHRTFPTNVLFSPGGQGIERLKNVLLAYSLHNPTVGYCQGMNLLAGTLLLTNNSEEEAFWIMTAMLKRHLPEDYFTQQLLSPQADQRVLRELVQEIMPRLAMHLQEMHVDLTAVTFSWFLTLFTDCLPVETLLRVWDVFFVEGMLAVFRIAVAILWMNEKEIIKCRNGAAVYCYMKQMTLSMNQADKLIKAAFVTLKSYIHPDKVELKRQRHQRSVRQELMLEQQQRQQQQLLRMKAFTPTSPPSEKKDVQC